MPPLFVPILALGGTITRPVNPTNLNPYTYHMFLVRAFQQVMPDLHVTHGGLAGRYGISGGRRIIRGLLTVGTVPVAGATPPQAAKSGPWPKPGAAMPGKGKSRQCPEASDRTGWPDSMKKRPHRPTRPATAKPKGITNQFYAITPGRCFGSTWPPRPGPGLAVPCTSRAFVGTATGPRPSGREAPRRWPPGPGPCPRARCVR